MNKSLKSVLIKLTYIIANYIVCNSKYNKDILLKINPFIKGKTKVIYNSIDFNGFKSSKPLYASNEVKLLVVGEYTYQKNYLGLIEALSRLRNKDLKRIKIDCYGANADNDYKIKCRSLFININ